MPHFARQLHEEIESSPTKPEPSSGLKTEKQNKIKDAETFWSDKINNREDEINIVIENKTSQIENRQVKAQNAERKETKSVNQLENKLEQIEINYEKAKNDIDKEINELFGK